MEEAAKSGYLATDRGGGGPSKAVPGVGEGDSAQAAQRAHHTTQRFVLLLQIRQVKPWPHASPVWVHGTGLPSWGVCRAVVRHRALAASRRGM